jgi:hypothetical protein
MTRTGTKRGAPLERRPRQPGAGLSSRQLEERSLEEDRERVPSGAAVETEVDEEPDPLETDEELEPSEAELVQEPAGHFQVRVGEKVYHLYGTRKSEAMQFKDYGMYDNPQVGAVFPVSEETLRAAQAAMDKAAQGAKQSNFPHFSISKKEPLFVKAKGKGRWMNVDTKRVDNMAVGQLRKIGGQVFFVAENGYREVVKVERRKGFRPECKTCTSFVTDPLFELAFKDLPRLKTFVARGLAGQLFSAGGGGIQPAAFTYYHPEEKNPADLGSAFSDALK